MAKRHLLSLLCILCLTSCSHVDVDDRLIYVEPPVVEPVQEDDTITIKPSVLIEDFTGQRCVNCPTAAEEIQRLKTQYGDSTIVAVGIHSGPLAVFPTDKAVGLRTQQGDDYYQHWTTCGRHKSAAPCHNPPTSASVPRRTTMPPHAVFPFKWKYSVKSPSQATCKYG